jgi:hypothetical protein
MRQLSLLFVLSYDIDRMAGCIVQGRSGSVALFLWKMVLANAALLVAEGAADRIERRALVLSIVVDIVTSNLTFNVRRGGREEIGVYCTRITSTIEVKSSTRRSLRAPLASDVTVLRQLNSVLKST